MSKISMYLHMYRYFWYGYNVIMVYKPRIILFVPLNMTIWAFFNRPFDRYNAVQLEELDNQARDDNDETEWQVFITSALETIMKVCN